MAVKIQSTKIVETPKGYVEMILSSAPDLETASDVLQVRMALATNEQDPKLLELQKVALQKVNAEIQRLTRMLGQGS
jgi:hypothetical protein